MFVLIRTLRGYVMLFLGGLKSVGKVEALDGLSTEYAG
jgi:hypothetical protein